MRLVADRRPGALSTLLGQLMRYGAVGAMLNAFLYLVYLGMTALGVPPLLAATAVFLGGIPLSLAGHGRVTFRAGPVSTGRKALFAGGYVVGYLVQIGTLAALHYGVGLPHAIAQLTAMLLVAAVLFVYQKKLVFEA